MKILCILFLITTPTDTLPPTDSLIQSLVQFYEIEAHANIQEYQYKEQYKWMKYVPNIGVGYNLQGNPRPTINFSLNTIYQYYNDKSRKNAKIKSIIQKNEVKLNRELMQLHSQLAKLKLKKQAITQSQLLLQKEKQLLELETQIFNIQKSKYDRNELLPSQFLKLKKSYLTVVFAYENKLYNIELAQQEIQRMEQNVLNTAKYYPKTTLRLEH